MRAPRTTRGDIDEINDGGACTRAHVGIYTLPAESAATGNYKIRYCCVYTYTYYNIIS